MIHFLIKHILRALPDRIRLRVLVMVAMECALVRPGNRLAFEIAVSKDGNWTSMWTPTPVPETHNNLSHCTAAGCDGIQCKHWKGMSDG